MYKERILANNLNRIIYDIPSKKANKGQLHGTQFHTLMALTKISSGVLNHRLNDKDYVAHEGDIIFININVPYCAEALTDGVAYSSVLFKYPKIADDQMKYLSGFLKAEDKPAYIFKKDDDDCRVLRAYIDDLIKYHNNTQIEYDYYINGIICMITSMLYKNKILNDSLKTIDTKLLAKLEPVFDYIHDNYSECINLEILSKILNLNQQYFCRLFKSICGTNVTDYVNFVRIQKAEKLLKTNMNISEIAENTGFSSLSYFNKTFKKYKNYSPREYKKLNVDIIKH